MNTDKKKLYLVSASLFLLLTAAFFVPSSSRIVASCLLLPGAAITSFLIKKRISPSKNKKQVLMLISVIGILYLILLYLSGMFFGFSKSIYGFSVKTFLRYTLPIAVIIISTEIIRGVLLAQKNKLSDTFTYLIGVLSETLIFYNIIDIKTFFRFMDFVGMALFPALISNFLYNYLSRRYGILPNIVFRFAVTLYPYIFELLPAIPDALLAFVKLVAPLLVLAFIRALYERKTHPSSRKTRKITVAVGVLYAAVMISVVMLISCRFRFGAIVIATESMTGEINKGDAVVYETYGNEIIKVGDVIIFKKNSSVFVHRVVEIQKINGRNVYYTKGDANEDKDEGFITDADVMGVAEFKVPFVGYPTIWMRGLFS